mmetsp:Transcript_22562/g.56989  ORF Transcript_22562/g.56989 Transcript_22562/m.56989 type:complete len:216 (+) Transcript_22562:181-828(+)
MPDRRPSGPRHILCDILPPVRLHARQGASPPGDRVLGAGVHSQRVFKGGFPDRARLCAIFRLFLRNLHCWDIPRGRYPYLVHARGDILLVLLCDTVRGPVPRRAGQNAVCLFHAIPRRCLHRRPGAHRNGRRLLRPAVWSLRCGEGDEVFSRAAAAPCAQVIRAHHRQRGGRHPAADDAADQHGCRHPGGDHGLCAVPGQRLGSDLARRCQDVLL